jgi:hypothetical protein
MSVELKKEKRLYSNILPKKVSGSKNSSNHVSAEDILERAINAYNNGQTYLSQHPEKQKPQSQGSLFTKDKDSVYTAARLPLNQNSYGFRKLAESVLEKEQAEPIELTPQSASDFIAGFSDTATFGLPEALRNVLWEDEVYHLDKHSAAYKFGSELAKGVHKALLLSIALRAATTLGVPLTRMLGMGSLRGSVQTWDSLDAIVVTLNYLDAKKTLNDPNATTRDKIKSLGFLALDSFALTRVIPGIGYKVSATMSNAEYGRKARDLTKWGDRAVVAGDVSAWGSLFNNIKEYLNDERSIKRLTVDSVFYFGPKGMKTDVFGDISSSWIRFSRENKISDIASNLLSILKKNENELDTTMDFATEGTNLILDKVEEKLDD